MLQLLQSICLPLILLCLEIHTTWQEGLDQMITSFHTDRAMTSGLPVSIVMTMHLPWRCSLQLLVCSTCFALCFMLAFGSAAYMYISFARTLVYLYLTWRCCSKAVFLAWLVPGMTW